MSINLAFLSETHTPKPGDVLLNGATVLAFRPLPDKPGCYPGGYVLALAPGYHPFVTWLFAQPKHAPAFCTLGHYYIDLQQALDDFEERE